MHSDGPTYNSAHDIKISNDQIKGWVKMALEAGWSAKKKKDNHIVIVSPDGKTSFLVTSTKVGGHALLEYRQKFKRAGFKV